MSESLNPIMVPPQAYVAHSGHGSVGPVIGILAAITVLTIIAIIIGRLCSGRRVMGRVGYDMEGWVETKCASCVDGRVTPPPPPPSRARRPQQEAMPSGGRELESSRASSFGEESSTRGSGRDMREKDNGRARPGPRDPSENV